MSPAEYERRLVRSLLERYGPESPPKSQKLTVLAAWVEGTHPTSDLRVSYFNHVDGVHDEERFPLYAGELEEHYTDGGATPDYAAFWVYYLLTD